MRRGPVSSVRVATVCARCGMRPDLYAVRRVTAFLPRRHDLVVCRYCDEYRPTTPSPMEQDAIWTDATDPVRCMEFTQRWGADVIRVQRTAEFFLSAITCAEVRAQASHVEDDLPGLDDGWDQVFYDDDDRGDDDDGV